MKKKHLQIPINKFEIEEIENSDLAKVKIYVMHEGKNLNGSNFSYDSMEDAKETIKNKPLVAVIEKDKLGEKDFKGHEIEYKIIKNENGEIDLEIIYVESPMGLVPETNNYHYEEVDGEKWVVVDGYIWKIYCKDAYEILKNADKKISMEISVNEDHIDDDGEYWIDEYEYNAITMLGETKNPAMGDNATISMYEISNKQEFMKSFESLSNEINLHLNKEVKRMGKENNKKVFEKSAEQIKDLAREKLSECTYIYENYWGESKERPKYCIMDVLVESKVLIVIDDETWSKYYGIPYTMDGDMIELDMNNIKRYIVGDWKEMQKDETAEPLIFSTFKKEFEDSLKDFETKIVEKTKESFDIKTTEEYTVLEKQLNDLKEKYSTKENEEGGENMDNKEFETLKSDFEEMKKNFEKIEEENKKLKEFEAEKLAEERAEKEKQVFAEYSELEEVEGFKEIKENANKYTLEELDTKLAVLFAKTVKTNKKFSIVETKEEGNGNGNVKVPVPNDDKKDLNENLYGGLFEKYGVK